EAAPGFMVVGAANPFDDVGTARLSRGLLDRFLVVEIDYQPRDEEIEIVRRRTGAELPRLCALAVDLARRTRGHPELRHGASVRAAIDLVGLVAAHLDQAGPGGRPQMPAAGMPLGVHLDREELRALVCAAFVGRVRPRPTLERSVCDLVMDLFDGLVQETLAGDLDAAFVVSGVRGPGVDDEKGSGAGDRDDEALAEGGQGSEGQAPEEARRDQVPGLERPGGTDTPGPSRSVPMVSRSQPPARGQLREAFDTPAEAPLASLEEVIRRAAELTLALRGDLDHRRPVGAGRWLHAAPWAPGGPGTLDVATTLATYVARAGDIRGSDLTVLQRAPEQVDYLIIVDHSGSMVGRKLGLAAVMAGVVAQLSATGRARYGVVAFDENLTTLKALDAEEDVADVVERILRLPEGKATDLAAALRVATEITGALPGASESVLISDCMPTRGTTGFEGLAALARRVPSLHICYIDEPLPAIQLFGSGPALNLYQWWARRWVGDDRVHTVEHPDELGDVMQRISTVQEGGLT
ncbi:MAG TPA: VWA domain-containing protein, partial [Acidimicrobiales bacterium]|nr:VWA domain-containing protein [Acidimicrobiales bacterium]